MKDFKQIEQLYKQYGYKCEETGDNYAVFSLSDAIYPGVDILVNEDCIYEQLRQKYADGGYSTNKVYFENVETLDGSLYRRFLRPSIAKRNMLERYKNYVDKILDPYRSDDKTSKGKEPVYKYIDVSYQYESDFMAASNSKNIISLLGDIIDSEGARLIIVEAAAGFGKTSTSYELLKHLCNKEDDKRPFLMELERDRQAVTFRYLLLSQIDRSFEVKLKNDIVVDNIKKGRIPLIIDGFDELLSRDMDRGREKVSFKMVETMLSTIAELLVGNSKVILTTRKTAIFTGEEFTEWYEHQKVTFDRSFIVDRIQLKEARVEDWFEGYRKELPPALHKVANPVLLSYLKYSDYLSKDEKVDADSLVNHYFSSMYKRELTRQKLTIKPSSQEKIMCNIAALFCLFDITAERRDDIKKLIYETNGNIIDDVVSDQDERNALLNKLANHALLDRRDSGSVGFLNDFIYGNLLGKAVVNNSELLKDLEGISMSNLQRIIEANDFLGSSTRTKVAESLSKLKGINPEMSFDIEYRLFGSIKSRYSQLNINDITFDRVKFNDGDFSSCSFVQCVFDSCQIDWSKVVNCTFISCTFKDSQYSNNPDSCSFYDCTDSPVKTTESDCIDIEETDASADNLDKEILKLFFRLGTENSRVRHISRIFNMLESSYSRREINRRLAWLQRNDYIFVNGDVAWILTKGSTYLKN